MKIRKIISGLTPPALAALYRRARGDFRSPWEGVYKSYREVPASDEGHENESVVGVMAKHARVLKEALAGSSEPGKEYPGENHLLPLLAGAVARGRPVKIIDFGGGLGTGYLHLKAAAALEIEYHVVELGRTCAEGRRMFEGTDDIFFHEELPAGLQNVDIVNINSALQYVEDYAGLLKKLAAYKPGHILLVRLPAGEIPTFAAMQTYVEGKKLPHWFFNIGEIIQLLAAPGYRMVYRRPAVKRYELDNFPEKYRLRDGCMCNLLFSRVD